MAKVGKKSTPSSPSTAPTGLAEQFRAPRYNVEQWWSAIVGAIPVTMTADADLMVTVRQQLEAAASGYLTLKHQHHIRFAEGSPAKLMLQAHDYIKAALDYAKKTDNTPLRDSLEKALKAMYETTQVEGFDILRLSRKGRTDPARDLLHHLVLKVWTDRLAGALTTGRKSGASPGKREANSPAIRFLIATLEPLVPIKPETAKKIVEAEKNERAALQKQIAALQERRKQPAKTVAE